MVAARCGERPGGGPRVGRRIEQLRGGESPHLVDAACHKNLAVCKECCCVPSTKVRQLRASGPEILGWVIEQRGSQDRQSIHRKSTCKERATVSQSNERELRPRGADAARSLPF